VHCGDVKYIKVILQDYPAPGVCVLILSFETSEIHVTWFEHYGG